MNCGVVSAEQLACCECAKRSCCAPQCAGLFMPPADPSRWRGPCCDDAVEPRGRACIGCGKVRLGSFFASQRVELAEFEVCFGCRARELYLEETS